MFSISWGGENLSVVFRQSDILRMAKDHFERTEQTSCAILGPDNVSKGTGVSIRAEEDEPNDVIGMREALNKALYRATRHFTSLTAERVFRRRFLDAFDRAVAGDDAYEAKVSAAFAQQYGRPTTGEANPRWDSNPSVPANTLADGQPIRFAGKVLPFRTVAQQERIIELNKRLADAQARNPTYCSPTGPCNVCKGMRAELVSLNAA